jgi:hypothetical protein
VLRQDFWLLLHLLLFHSPLFGKKVCRLVGTGDTREGVQETMAKPCHAITCRLLLSSKSIDADVPTPSSIVEYGSYTTCLLWFVGEKQAKQTLLFLSPFDTSSTNLMLIQRLNSVRNTHLQIEYHCLSHFSLRVIFLSPRILSLCPGFNVKETSSVIRTIICNKKSPC